MAAHIVRRKTALVALEIAVPLVLLATWWFWSSQSANPFFPALAQIVERFRDLWLFDNFMSDIVPSMRNLIVGFALGVGIGVVLGFVFALARPIRELLEPTLNFLRSIPPVAIIPILIALFGFGEDVRILTIVLSSLFPTLISTMDGLRSVDPTLKDVSYVYGLQPHERLLGVYLPAALPQMFSGFQVSLQISFVVMIASEMLGSSQGIGAMTLLAQQSFVIPDMWAGIILLGIIGYIANLMLSILRNRALHWYDGAKQIEKAF